LERGVRPRAKSSSGYLVEINLKKQLLMLVKGGRVQTIFNTSTGSNHYYVYQGERRLAVTPRGHYRVYRQIDGWRHGPLGPLWRPKYFNGGIAVHGAYSVPPYPASHGCSRVSIAAMNWIWANGKLPLKTRVWVY
jgi:lipoprotein-anchoring transpeptidase ErfK/SrfK